MARTSSHNGYRFTQWFVPFRKINVLAQPRKTFEDIGSLAGSLARHGFIKPPLVGCYSRDQYLAYLQEINNLWEANYVIDDQVSVEDDENGIVYYVLIGGERRCRALDLLWRHGCNECQAEAKALGKKLKEGQCFRRHYGRLGRIEVRLAIGVPVVDALELQFAENTHMPVPAWEEAQAYGRFYGRLREMGRVTSLAGFASSVGRKPETIKRALWYCELPDIIQRAVEERSDDYKPLAYGIAVQLARLQVEYDRIQQEKRLKHLAAIDSSGREEAQQEAIVLYPPMPEPTLVRWMTQAMANNWKVPDAEERVSKFLADQQSGQLELGGLMTAAADEEERRLAVKKAVEANTLQGLWGYFHYFGRVLWLCEHGKFGIPESPFSTGSTLRIFRRALDRMEQVLPHLRQLQLLPRKELERAPRVIRKAKDRIARLLKEAGEEEEIPAAGGGP